MANKIKKKDNSFKELDLMPFMNLLITLVPLLLLSAEFAKVSIIDIKLPEQRGSQTEQTVKAAPKEDESNKLLLTAIITDSVVTIGAKSAFLPSLFYQEFHHYIAKDDNTDFTVKYDPLTKEMPKHPKTGRPMEIYERYDIYLYVTDENYSAIKSCMYTKFGELVTNFDGEVLERVSVGDTVYALANPRRMILVSDPAEFGLKQLSVYDELKNRLMKVKERFKDADDADAIIIAAENQVFYDKIIQLMDAARGADFPSISIAKLRG